MNTIRAFLSKIRTHFSISKRIGEASPLTLVARLWVWLTMHQYPGLCLNVLENAWINCSGYIGALNMYDHHLTCLTGFWKCLGFWLWHGCIRVTQGSICLNNAWICRNIHQYVWTPLNMPENAWMNSSDYARVLSILLYINNISILATVIILEFLSARFIHLVSLLPFYFF